MTISSLGYVVVKATDLSAWETFGTEVLGMMPADAPDGKTRWLQMDERPFRIAIEQGDADRYGCAGWEVSDKQAFDALIEKLEAAGTTVERGSKSQADARCVTEIASCADPCGNHMEFYHGRVYDYRQFISPKGVSGFITGDMGLGHTVLPCPDLKAAYDFYVGLMGFGVTDHMHFKFSEDPEDPGQGLHFLHADNPRHHSLALYEAPHPAGCVHIMVETNNIDDIGYCIDRCAEHNVAITSSLGRHTNDKMLSFYMNTPAGFALEFGCDGWQVDWSTYQPTTSRLPSIWGHKWSPPE